MFHTLAGLIGARRTQSGYRSSWAIPFWHEDNAGLFATPVYGQTKDSHWIFPLWFKSEKAFVSPPNDGGRADAPPHPVAALGSAESGRERLTGRLPYFTYDRRKDGSVQISLLRRLFRYVRTKDAQTSIDLIYLPIWR